MSDKAGGPSFTQQITHDILTSCAHVCICAVKMVVEVEGSSSAGCMANCTPSSPSTMAWVTSLGSAACTMMMVSWPPSVCSVVNVWPCSTWLTAENCVLSGVLITVIDIRHFSLGSQYLNCVWSVGPPPPPDPLYNSQQSKQYTNLADTNDSKKKNMRKTPVLTNCGSLFSTMVTKHSNRQEQTVESYPPLPRIPPPPPPFKKN